METCDPGYALCDDLHPCSPHLCDSNGESTSCGKQNIISPDGTYTIQNQKQNWFCAATASGEYPVDRSQFNVRMGYNPNALEPYCCIQPKPPGLCVNNGTEKDDGTCDCSTATVTLTDCYHGLVNYSGDGTNNTNPNGRKFNLNYSGKICDIAPTKLPDNFVKYFFYEGDDNKHCIITGLDNQSFHCNGDTTTCTVNQYGGMFKDDVRIGGTICGNNNNTGLDHQCGQY